ncbi:TerD family protein [Streptomyces sp. NPDC052042]|uniref:TerD family protein n=1 Tax=Streptomyces sp. NPDC052042 TaxID=3365683 RepID=UPI0037D97F98
MGGRLVNGIRRDVRKIEVALKWDPSPSGEPASHLDIVAATYLATAPYGDPSYVVHWDSRSPDGTIYLNRDSKDGKGLGWDEVMTLELDRLDSRYARVVVGVVIHQNACRRTFAGVLSRGLRLREGYNVLEEDDFSGVLEATAATVGEFVREDSGTWTFRPGIRGYDEEAAAFTRIMGHAPEQTP